MWKSRKLNVKLKKRDLDIQEIDSIYFEKIYGVTKLSTDSYFIVDSEFSRSL